jgi:UDPglucose 6-dehydrogenase
VEITVIGAGYVGLVAAAGFAKLGHRVHCIESDSDKLALLQRGRCPIYEPGLEQLLASEAERLSFEGDLATALEQSLVCFVCVGTPQAADGSADMTATEAVLEQIGRAMTGHKVIVLKSTVPVGTHLRAARILGGHTQHTFDVVSNPEFLREGSAVSDFLNPDRVVLGIATSRAEATLRELYAPLLGATDSKLVLMDNASAEITKYAANAMLATRISFINEIANLCEVLGADITRVRAGMELDPRIGGLFLDAGIGYGGCCFPKDVRALIHTGADAGRPLEILAAVDKVNRAQRSRIVEKVVAHFGDALSGSRIALWGLSFKPNTDDVRDAPAVSIVEALLARGARVTAYDPKANRGALPSLPRGFSLSPDAFTAAAGADALLVATEWEEFVNVDLIRLRAELARPLIFDGRNLWNPAKMAKLGYTYHSVGRRPLRPEHVAPRLESSLRQTGGI